MGRRFTDSRIQGENVYIRVENPKHTKTGVLRSLVRIINNKDYEGGYKGNIVFTHSRGTTKKKAPLEPPNYAALNQAFSRNEGQLFPVARKTSSAGIRRDFIPKTIHEWGNAGSQLTLKCAHLRQLGMGGTMASIAGSVSETVYALRLNIVPICGTAGAKGFFTFAA